MAIITAPAPDSETEVIVSVDEISDSAAENGPETPTKAAGTSAAEVKPAAGENVKAGADDDDDDDAKLYEHRCAYEDCSARWSKSAVNQEEQDELVAQVRSTPIVHRHTYQRDEREWVTKSFEVNCGHMRAFLSEALADYQDLDLDLEGWSFAPPYNPLVHRWERILGLHKELQTCENDSDKKKAVDQLVGFLQPLLAPSISDLANTQDTGQVEYDMIWQIFPPGEIVLRNVAGVDALHRVAKAYKSESEEVAWVITLEYVDWDGERCGLRTMEQSIPFYTGVQRVTSLPVYPLSYAKDPEQIKESVRARGRKFQQLRGYHFLQYNGIKLALDSDKKETPRSFPQMGGRVMIDSHAYYVSNNYLKPDMEPLPAKATESDTPESKEGANENDTGDGEMRPAEKITTADRSTYGRVEDLSELPDEYCLLTNPLVIGFDLRAKDWAEYHIDNLVLPGGEKELAWEFVQSKTASKENFDDFVSDKGRDITILMFGPPGKARVPLYRMSAGMLGTNPEVVEQALDQALMLCRLWNAMLLLDEAEVFLGARLDDTLHRNELVSVFLTKLEYCQGILFLTTNRFTRIDHAFQSRVDLFLPYQDLDAATRKQIWSNFIGHFGRDKFDISTEDVDRLSQLPINGREIKNLIKSAQLLKLRTGGKVTTKRLFMLADKRMMALKMLEKYSTGAQA
ncbi:P-loop containing nucleoside triphosphate hydrolase protein [Corynascus novoguineensis]|uniref:P-loop containing nucleoside triphosphate hydrolase protein n=1 Tax=Corynascus novoguineensis TaxID=1126955 RepID=A0AAN7CS93_9PEZI|nr:P-loop containing nucleoside triphosphate hydrolase protein [Corynascus novoguineensis]